jgi:hypothetical protein
MRSVQGNRDDETIQAPRTMDLSTIMFLMFSYLNEDSSEPLLLFLLVFVGALTACGFSELWEGNRNQW